MSTALSWVVDDLELKNAREHKEIARLRRECREVTRRCHGKSQKEKDMEALERRLAEEERRKAAEEMDTLALLREHERLKAEKQKGRKLDGVLTKLEKQIERERRGVTVPNPGQTLRRKDTMARTGTRPATLGAGPSILEKAANCRGGMKGAIASMRAGMMAVKSQASIIRMLQKDNDEKVKKNKEEEEICKRKPRYLHGLLPAEEEYLAAQCANARGKRKGSAASDESLTFQEVRDIMKTCGMKTNMNIRDLREMSARYRSEGHKGLMQDAFLAFIFKFRLENMKMFESVEWRLQDDGGQVTASETAAPPKRRPRPGVRPVSGIRRYTDPADLPFLVDIRRKPPDVRPAPKTRPSTAWAGERSNTQGQERDGQVDSELRQRPTTALGRPAGKEDGRNGQAVSDKGAIGADSNTSAVKRPATSLGLRTAGSHGEGRQREVSQLCDRYLTFRKTAFAARPDEGDRSRRWKLSPPILAALRCVLDMPDLTQCDYRHAAASRP
jgi:hypothetical protein